MSDGISKTRRIRWNGTDLGALLVFLRSLWFSLLEYTPLSNIIRLQL